MDWELTTQLTQVEDRGSGTGLRVPSSLSQQIQGVHCKKLISSPKKKDRRTSALISALLYENFQYISPYQKNELMKQWKIRDMMCGAESPL